jgi:hypothetical protein
MINYAYTTTSITATAGHLAPPSEDKEWRLVETHFTAFPSGAEKIFCVWAEVVPAVTLGEQMDRMRRREIYRVEPDF